MVQEICNERHGNNNNACYIRSEMASRIRCFFCGGFSPRSGVAEYNLVPIEVWGKPIPGGGPGRRLMGTDGLVLSIVS